MIFSTKNTKIYYEKYGSGQKIILILPGWGNTRETFYNLISILENDYTVYIFDYPGFGKSPIPNKVFTIYDYSDVIYDFISNRQLNIYGIIAHSFGGRLASLLISKNKLKVNKLILIDVAGIKERSIKTTIKQTIYKGLRYITKLFPNRMQTELQNKLRELFSSKDYKELPHGMDDTFKNIVNEDLRKYYKMIKIPTLIIWGDKDLDTPLRSAKYLNKVINDSGLIIFKGANHFSYLNFPYRTMLIVSEFFKEKES